MPTLKIDRTMLLATAITFAATTIARLCQADDKPTGEAIYQAKCASCHGAKGEGVKTSYGNPLIGDRSIGELIEYISKSMPEDKPGTCTGDEATLVSHYIYDQFYSPAAQVRLQPARIELSRLTVRQYRNVIADLIGHFRWSPDMTDQHGLRGIYQKKQNVWDKDFAIDRVDPVVDFNFENKSPDPDKIDPHQFSIRWEGSIFAPDTGEYEITVKTDQAVLLWVNDHKHPLIDAKVKSGNDLEHRSTLFLLGGRYYPMRLEFYKSKQGVKDDKEKERPPANALISLLWKRPSRLTEVIPTRYLSPVRSAEVCVLATNFPPDDRSRGWESAASISKEWDEATTEAAMEVEDYIEPRLNELAGTKNDAGDRNDKLKNFCLKFVERAFRRPLNDELRKIYIDHQFEKEGGPEAATKRVILLSLKSPRFLYREVTAANSTENDPYDVAARMSFGLWDSLPSQQLLQAAARNELKTPEQVSAQASKMVSDPRCRSKMRDFLLKWLKIERVPMLSKDPELYPEFTEAVADDLRTSLELSLEELLNSDDGDFRQLLLSDSIYLNGRLAKFYGSNLPPEASFQKVTLESAERAGVLSHPYLLSDFAYTGTSSPIHRGIFIARSVLGRSLRPPPEAVAPLSPKLEPNLTTRERVALQTRAEVCMSCHSMINALGFTFEHFDAVGRFRTDENGKPVNSTGAYRTRNGDTVSFQGVEDLANYLADCSETHEAFVEQVFHGLIKQSIRAYGPQTKDTLRQKFVDEKFKIRRLLVEIIVISALKASDAGTQTAAAPPVNTGTGG